MKIYCISWKDQRWSADKESLKVINKLIANKNITISKQDTIISNLNLQIKNFNNAIKLQDQKFLTSQKLSQELEVALKRAKRQTKLYKIGTIVGGVAIGILIIK